MRSREGATQEEVAFKRQKAADFVVQLAVKRGVKLRPASVGRGVKQQEQHVLEDDAVPGLLLAQNPQLCESAEENSLEEVELAAQMLWYNDLAG